MRARIHAQGNLDALPFARNYNSTSSEVPFAPRVDEWMPAAAVVEALLELNLGERALVGCVGGRKIRDSQTLGGGDRFVVVLEIPPT